MNRKIIIFTNVYVDSKIASYIKTLCAMVDTREKMGGRNVDALASDSKSS